jgi:pimeloyl-ACP methyl ester carboxylesterase
MIELRHAVIHGHDIAYRMAGPTEGDDGATPSPDAPAGVDSRGRPMPEHPSGLAETIVLIHGMAGSSRTWRDVMPELTRRHRVVAPDLVGHGRSDKPPGDYSLGAFASGLRDLLDRLDVDRATIVGQSLGGGVALQFAYQFPERCSRLILVSSGGLGREVSWMLRLLALPGAELVLPVVAPAVVAERGNGVSRWLRDHGIRAERWAEMWQAYASLTSPENRQAFLRTLRAVVDPGGQAVDASDRLYLTEAIPTLIIWGDADGIIPVTHAHAAHEAMPGSRLEIFAGIGHFPQVEAPERFLEVVGDFMASTSPAAMAARVEGDARTHEAAEAAR